MAEPFKERRSADDAETLSINGTSCDRQREDVKSTIISSLAEPEVFQCI